MSTLSSLQVAAPCVQANAEDEGIQDVLSDYGTLKVPYVVVLRKGQLFGSCLCTDMRYLKRFVRKARELNDAEFEMIDSSDATESSGTES